jgi:CRP/FNR family transcriptional regulator, anaerobic regulatory protein
MTELMSRAASVCSTLADDDLCLPCGLARAEPTGITMRRQRVERFATLYRQHDAFGALHVVHAGSFKSVVHTHDGLEQVAGLHLAGEILGLDGLVSERHESSPIALEDSEVLVLPYLPLQQFTTDTPGLHDMVARLISREIVRERGRLQLLAHRKADVRLGAFLLDVAQRMRARGFSGTEFHLRLTREEIGSYLGMNLETVSRAFGTLQQQGMLAVQGKHVRLLDAAALAGLAGEAPA